MEGLNTTFRSPTGESTSTRPIRKHSSTPTPRSADRRMYRSMFAEMSQLSSCLMVDPLEDREVYGSMS